MICPICGGEMEEGGLIASGISVMWFPLEQFAKKGLERLWYEGRKVSRKVELPSRPYPDSRRVLLPRLPENNRHFRYFP